MSAAVFGGNSSDHARERLALLEECHDATSFHHAAALGVDQGWICLDAGAGHGSFARWLSEQVGESGSVVATDTDVRLLQELKLANVEVRQLDLAREDLPAKRFDLVHTRMTLTHLPERDDVLAKLAAALKPGGVLLVEEQDMFPVALVRPGAYADAWSAYLEAVAGVDGEWARALPRRLTGIGLTRVEASVDVQLFSGGSPAARLWSLTWEQSGLGDVLERGREALEDAGSWFYGPAMVIASGYRRNV